MYKIPNTMTSTGETEEEIQVYPTTVNVYSRPVCSSQFLVQSYNLNRKCLIEFHRHDSVSLCLVTLQLYTNERN